MINKIECIITADAKHVNVLTLDTQIYTSIWLHSVKNSVIRAKVENEMPTEALITHTQTSCASSPW